MVNRWRGFLLLVTLIVASLAVSAAPALAEAVGVLPDKAPPGTEITVFGDGFMPFEVITIFFGGTEVITEADGEGSFTTTLVIDELMPPGFHPMEISGDMGSFIDFEYEVTQPPPPTTEGTTTTQAPTTTTQAPTTTTVAETTTTAAPTTTTAPDSTTTPVTVVDDTRVSTSSGGVPWWIFLLAILLALVLGAVVMMALNRSSTMKAGFTDEAGKKWQVCSRGCKVERTNDLNNTRVIRAVPKGSQCPSDCACVLFSWPNKGEGVPRFEDGDGAWIPVKPKRRYKAKCVKAA